MKSWLFIVFLLTCCSTGTKEVKYSEMGSEPKIKWVGQELIVETENSRENSALLIYSIEPTIDKEDNQILLYGFQAAGKEYRTEFRMTIEGVPIDKHGDYKIFWVDPDGKRTELQIE